MCIAASGIVVYTWSDHAPRFLLLENARHHTWGFPKGHLEEGEDLYQGDCKTCHGRKGEGKARKESPPLRGQYTEYLARQIEIMIQPILVDEEHLQADLIERVGIGGHYLKQRETRDFTRRGYVPVWPPADKTMLEIAHEEALDILYNHQPPPLPRGAEKKNEAIVAEADRTLA